MASRASPRHAGRVAAQPRAALRGWIVGRISQRRQQVLLDQWAAGGREEALIIELASCGLITRELARSELLRRHPHWAQRLNPTLPNPKGRSL